MAQHQITCVTKETVQSPSRHEHIVSVRADGVMKTVKQVIADLDAGETFYTVSPSKGTKASVKKFDCTVCASTVIRSTPDAIPDNNLDNLPKCT